MIRIYGAVFYNEIDYVKIQIYKCEFFIEEVDCGKFSEGAS